MALIQDNRLLSLKTPLGDNVLVLTSIKGHEEISRLFEYQLNMLSDNPDIQPADIVGKNVTVGIDVPDGDPRYVNGFINTFFAGDVDDQGRCEYFATLVPWLWFLTQTSDCRIFQNKTIPNILEQIYLDLGFSEFDRQGVKGTHLEWDYCVQYRESDFQFVSRLMEQEGIHFHFRHENGKHTMIMGDNNAVFRELPEKQVDFPTGFGSHTKNEHIKRWQHGYHFRPGKWAQTDFNFETPSTQLLTKVNTVVKLPSNAKYEIYDFPGKYAEKSTGETETKIRMEEVEVQYDLVQAASNCRTFASGGKFTIGTHRTPREVGKSYIITSLELTARETLAYETKSKGEDKGGDEKEGAEQGGHDYQNSFVCIPESVPFRPPRITPKPIIQGVQTAIVVGPGGEELYTDEFGRVKVQFHWDREGKKDENSSCWIRVSQTHAGKGFGSVSIPRVDEEVIVSFLEGDPDCPIITGRVYHAENKPPFGLPAGKSLSGIKSNSTKGGGGYNELVMDDTKGKEMVRTHAQYDMSTAVEHDQSLTVNNDRTVTVLGKLTEKITGDTSVEILSGEYSHRVAANKATYHVQGDIEETYASNQTTKVTGIIACNSDAQIQIEAANEIRLVSGSSSITLKSDGTIEISGTKIVITGTSETKIGVGNQCVICDTAQVATSGAAINSSAVGKHEITGALVKIN